MFKVNNKDVNFKQLNSGLVSSKLSQKEYKRIHEHEPESVLENEDFKDYVKSVQIQSYFWSVFGHFSRSEGFVEFQYAD